MLLTPTKRPSSRSPSSSRPSKRTLISSPEEGELDDGSPRPPPSTLDCSTITAAPSPLPETTKSTNVPFPFKKKSDITNGLGAGSSNPKVGLGNHDRRGDSRDPRSSTSAGDFWQSFSSYNRRDNESYRHSSHRDHYYHSRSDSRRHNRDGYVRNNDRHRDRSRTPRSRSRTLSPVSPHRSREKHRLPAPRSPEDHIAFSPPRRNYGLDRQERYEYWNERDSHYHDYDGYSRRDNIYERDSRDHDRYTDRQWRQNSASRRDAGRSPHKEAYGPVSPSRSIPSTPPLSNITLDSQTFHPSRSPPPPPLLPPPPPPPVDGLNPGEPPKNGSKDSKLPQEHTAVSIPLMLKRPGAPREQRSPEPISLVAVDREIKEITGSATNSNGTDKLPFRPTGLPPKPTQPSGAESVLDKRVVFQRSRKEEEKAYGRVFVGCGQKEDYEMTTKLGEGTFGEVHKAVCKKTGASVALKRILMHNEKEGMPVTALREIKILKALRHPCIVELLDMFVVRSNSREALSVYMVFPYMDHDLAGLLENERVTLQPSHIKLYMKQLLEGTEYMHRNNILHRDMKAANLLISNSGSLQIADFGLARAFDPTMRDHRGRERKYTNCVVTRWYRPPELLLGARQYGGEVDMWGIGCVLGEMFQRRPILPGNSDLDQLEKIWKLCGTPNQHSWPNFDRLPGCDGMNRITSSGSRKLKQVFDSLGPETCDLLDKMLTCNPRERITALQALDHDYFWSDPLPADPKTLPSWDSSHEYDRRGRRQHHHPPPQQHQQQQPPPPSHPHLRFGGQPPRHGRPPMHPNGPGPYRPTGGYYPQGPSGQFYHRGPPPREAFRTGPPLGGPPPPPHPPSGPAAMGGHPHPPPHPYHFQGPPMRPPYGPAGHPGNTHYRGPPPSLGGQHPPPPMRHHGSVQALPPPPHWGDRGGERAGVGGEASRPAHLPPRPSASMARGPNDRGGGGDGASGSAGASTAAGNEDGGTTELNYG